MRTACSAAAQALISLPTKKSCKYWGPAGTNLKDAPFPLKTMSPDRLKTKVPNWFWPLPLTGRMSRD